MSQLIKKSSFIDIWLNLLFIIYVTSIMLAWIIGYNKGNLVDLFLLTFVCIISAVGFFYAGKKYRLGIYLPLVVLLLILGGTIGVEYLNKGGVYVSIILLLLTWGQLLFIKRDDKSLWMNMKKLPDRGLTKLIGSIAVLGIVFLFGIKGYAYIQHDNVIKPNNELVENVSIEMLDKASVTLKQISVIEKTITDISTNNALRIMALKHILSGHLIVDNHNLESFRNTYFLRKDDLSKEQQDVLDWFFRQHSDVQKLWEFTGSSNSIEAFQEQIKRMMKERNMAEF